MIFPELKNVKIFSKLDKSNKNLLKDKDFIFLISLMIIDETDNTDYFFYKYNVSKKDKKRVKIIDNFYKEKINTKTFTEKNLNQIFYYSGKQAVLDILKFRMIKSKKTDEILQKLCEIFENKKIPSMPVTADMLIKKYNLSEGKQLGEKLRVIEEEWVKNSFRISNQQIENIVHN
jgi:hypothetical protein